MYSLVVSHLQNRLIFVGICRRRLNYKFLSVTNTLAFYTKGRTVRRHDIQHTDTQHYDTQHNSKKIKTPKIMTLIILAVYIMRCYDECHLCWASQISPFWRVSLCLMSLCQVSWRRQYSLEMTSFNRGGPRLIDRGGKAMNSWQVVELGCTREY